MTQCRAYRIARIPDFTPTPCLVLMGEPAWWARAGKRDDGDVAVGQALAVCIESVDLEGDASPCGEILEYREDLLWN